MLSELTIVVIVFAIRSLLGVHPDVACKVWMGVVKASVHHANVDGGVPSEACCPGGLHMRVDQVVLLRVERIIWCGRPKL